MFLIIQSPAPPVHCFPASMPKQNACPPNSREQCLCIHPRITTCQRAGFAKPSKFVPGSPELTWVAIWGLENGKIDVSEGKRLKARAVTECLQVNSHKRGIQLLYNCNVAHRAALYGSIHPRVSKGFILQTLQQQGLKEYSGVYTSVRKQSLDLWKFKSFDELPHLTLSLPLYSYWYQQCYQMQTAEGQKKYYISTITALTFAVLTVGCFEFLWFKETLTHCTLWSYNWQKPQMWKKWKSFKEDRTISQMMTGEKSNGLWN